MVRAIFYTPKPSQIKRFVYSTNKMFIYNSSVLDVFCLYTWHSFFIVRPCFTHFFFTGRPRLTQASLPSRRGGLTSHRQTSHREAFLTQRPFLTQRGPTSHREASPHTERPHLTQGGPPSPHAGKPHADMLSPTGKPHLTQANFTQAFLVSHVCSKKKSKQMSSERTIQSLWVFKRD